MLFLVQVTAKTLEMLACIFGVLGLAWFFVINADSNDAEERQERAKVAYKEAQKTYKKALKHADDLEMRNAEGMTPLMLAAEANDLGPVIELVEKGASINTRSNAGWTPLMYAARRGNVKMVQFLLEHGASVNAKEMDGRTPLLCAVTPRNGVDSLKNCEKRFPVSHGDSMINPEVLQLLLEHGAVVDAKDEKYGLTALQYCFLHDPLTYNQESVPILLKHGASARVTTGNGNTLLHLAVAQGVSTSSKTVRLLLEHGASIYAENKKGETALQFYLKKLWRPSASIVRLFLEHGADINTTGEDGESLLHFVSKDHGDDVSECVRFLLKRGIPVDIRDHKGNTPLMIAAWQGELTTVQLLLENGASLNARSSGGWSVLMNAALGGNAHKVKFLLEKGATITLEDLKELQWRREDMIKAGFYWDLQDAAYR